MPRINSIIFIKIGLKWSYFCQKNWKCSSAGDPPYTLCLRWLGDFSPQTPIAFGGWGSAPRPPHCRFLAKCLHQEKFTAHYCRPPFILAFGFKYAWNVWRRRCSHSQMVYNTAKSILSGNTYTEKLSQKILSSALTPLWPRWGFFFLITVRSFNKFYRAKQRNLIFVQHSGASPAGGQGGIAPLIFDFPPDLFLAPHGIFLGGKSCCFWLEKSFEFVISARNSLRISTKIFFWRSPDFDWNFALIQVRKNESLGQVQRWFSALPPWF